VVNLFEVGGEFRVRGVALEQVVELTKNVENFEKMI
jgi:hypothetical protein